MMQDPPQVFRASEVQAGTRISPARRILDRLEGEYYVAREVADKVGVHLETLRRLCRTDEVKAPTFATQQGKLVIYLFTPEDIEEIKDYYSARSKPGGKRAD